MNRTRVHSSVSTTAIVSPASVTSALQVQVGTLTVGSLPIFAKGPKKIRQEIIGRRVENCRW